MLQLDLEWCYQSQVSCNSSCLGPDKWHLEASATSCEGKSQSPVNIVTRKTVPDERLTPFEFTAYQQTFNGLIKNNGHTVQVDLQHTAKISGGHLPSTYKALQLHLHWGKDGSPGSEHTIDGEQYPMEMHIVHIKEKYNSLAEALGDTTGVAVLGFFYETSASANKKYDPIITALKNITETGSNTSLSGVSLDMLIPAKENRTQYYRYEGSLTTPDCTEAVVWTVFENTIPLSKQQLSEFSKLRFGDGEPMVGTFRPVQPLNTRLVYRSGSSVVLASTALLLASVMAAVGL
ncbi:hypothetical protein MATL_G00122900 [Megalops atlanticus]|uniref:Carbonic anhydrase n=1 Tax=Megalops atlanticus TaxID=7932 RepID=A0A9D3T8I8_MEGAT|nr:hypothetical protein MATL_G00122900 [Megalops atlanticus]